MNHLDTISKRGDLIRVTWADIHGKARTKIMMSRKVNCLIKESHGVDAYLGTLGFGLPNIVPDWESLIKSGHANMTLKIDEKTLVPVRWTTDGNNFCGEMPKLHEVLCDCYWLSSTDAVPNDSIPFCPRQLAKEAIKQLHALKLNLFSAFEFEFRLYKASAPAFRMDFSSGDVLTEVEPYTIQLAKALRKMNIEVEAVHTELGSGMIEVTMKPTYGIKGADNAFRFKRMAHEVAKFMGLEAVFMTKPILGETANGLHYNHSLWRIDTGKNIFYDTEAKELTPEALQWVSGLVRWTKPMTAIYCPTVNCYRRLYNDWGPEKANWGIQQRTTSYRVNLTSTYGTYVENRIPSASSNPYLVLAANVLSGIHAGFDKEVIPPNHSEPTPLARTLKEALQDLQDDSSASEALGKELVDIFVGLKSKYEVKVFDQVDDLEKEKEMYWNLL